MACDLSVLRLGLGRWLEVSWAPPHSWRAVVFFASFGNQKRKYPKTKKKNHKWLPGPIAKLVHWLYPIQSVLQGTYRYYADIYMFAEIQTYFKQMNRAEQA